MSWRRLVLLEIVSFLFFHPQQITDESRFVFLGRVRTVETDAQNSWEVVSTV
jgi:hypothetical protein